MKKNNKYNYVTGTRIEDHGSRLYDVNGARLPSVTTILGRTKDQQFIKDWKAKVGEAEAERNAILSCRWNIAIIIAIMDTNCLQKIYSNSHFLERIFLWKIKY